MPGQGGTPIKVALSNTSLLYVEAREISPGSDERDVVDAQRILSFEGVRQALEGVAGEVALALERVKPKKASVEFGIEVALESGRLTALLVKGSGTANLKVTLGGESD